MQDRKSELQNKLAKIIKKHRKYSISQICLEVDISKSLWSVLEKGEKDITLTTLWRIAEAFDMKPSELLSEIEDELGNNFSFLENTSGN